MILDWRAPGAKAQQPMYQELAAQTWTTAANGFVPPTPTPTPTASESPLGGSKLKKKIRGPYSDPRIFEEYIKRCIAEREAPRENVEVAVLKEALVEQVERRVNAEEAEYAGLVAENQTLQRLLSLEKTRRDLKAIRARQEQIERQIQELEDEEVSKVLALWMSM